MSQTENRKTQTDLFKDELERLKIDLTTKDISACKEEIGISATSLSNYLNRKGNNNDTAAKLIAFFKKRIEERNKVLENA